MEASVALVVVVSIAADLEVDSAGEVALMAHPRASEAHHPHEVASVALHHLWAVLHLALEGVDLEDHLEGHQEAHPQDLEDLPQEGLHQDFK